MQCDDDADDSGLPTRFIEIFAEEEWEEGRRQANELVSLLESKRPGQKFALHAGIPQVCKAGSVAFHRHGPELLKAGEAPGDGLHSELADVLRLQVCMYVCMC
jgi:hypothetical protein